MVLDLYKRLAALTMELDDAGLDSAADSVRDALNLLYFKLTPDEIASLG